VYLEASSVVKLIVQEAESDPLRGFLANVRRPVSSELSLAEAARAVQRRMVGGRAGHVGRRFAEVFGQVHLRALDRDLLAYAGWLKPEALRTLDAIHLATALSLPQPRTTFVSYDHRQLAAARQAGLATVSPGWEST